MPTKTIDAKDFPISDELLEQFSTIWGVPGVSIEQKVKDALSSCKSEEDCVQLYSYALLWCKDVRPMHLGTVSAKAGRSHRDRLTAIALTAAKQRNRKLVA